MNERGLTRDQRLALQAARLHRDGRTKKQVSEELVVGYRRAISLIKEGDLLIKHHGFSPDIPEAVEGPDTPPDVLADMHWVYRHLGNADIELSDAPTEGAYYMLLEARENRSWFLKQYVDVTKKLGASESATNQEREDDASRTVAEIHGMLRESLSAQ